MDVHWGSLRKYSSGWSQAVQGRQAGKVMRGNCPFCQRAGRMHGTLLWDVQ